MPPERPDLNLFRVFDAVMRHRNLAATGRELGITASAVSHALTRLRAMLADELFASGPRGMVPSARATELAPAVTGALAAFGTVLAARPFDPAATRRTLRIGASDHTGALFLPGLVERALRDAPGLRLRVLPIGRTDLVEHLDEGRLDLVVSWFGTTPGRIRRQSLFEEREALVVRPGHPLAGTQPDKAALLSFPHAVVELVGGSEPAPDGFFDERGLHRRVWAERLLLDETVRHRAGAGPVVTVPNFGLVCPLLHSSDLVATLPFRLARRLAAAGELAMLALPYTPITITTDVAWHERTDNDPAVRWVIDQVAACCAGLDPLPPLPDDSSPD